MKAISQHKHENLCGSLKELQYLLMNLGPEANLRLKVEVSRKLAKLEEYHEDYQELLKQLASLIKSYDELAMDSRQNLLGKHLKEFKNSVKPGQPGYEHWQLGKELLYGT